MPSPARADLHKALYVPAATVSLGAPSQDLLHVHGLAITSVEVDLQLSVAGTFRFTIPNAFDAARAEFLTARGQPALNLLKLGTRVWIRMGYGDRSGQPLLLSGYITNVGTNFAEGGSPDLEVSGQDALYRLTLGTNEHRLEKKSVQDAVAKVAVDNGFSLRLSGSPPGEVTLDSNLQSDMDFLRQLTANFSTRKQKWEFFSRAGEQVDTLHFRPRSMDAASIGTLKWGADLLSFRPEANLGNQVARVEVQGWDEVAKVKIVGEARAQGEGGKAKTGGQIQQSFLSREVVRTLRLPVKSKKEADERAEAELANTISDHLKGEGETFGFPELLPDTRVRLDGLGAKFSRTFYVTKTVHSYNASGYRTRFSVEEPDFMSPPPDFFSESRPRSQGRVTGVVTGIVTSNTDPDYLGRVKLRLPWRSDDFETDWARVVAPMAGKERGIYFLPEVDDEVLVAFDGDDIRYPYVLGVLWSKTDPPPDKNEDGKNRIRLIKTTGGHLIKFVDRENEDVLLIQLRDGKKVEIKSEGIQIDDGANKIILDAKSGAVTIEAKASLTLKAPKISIEAGNALDIKGGQSLSAAATIVRIN